MGLDNGTRWLENFDGTPTEDENGTKTGKIRAVEVQSRGFKRRRQTEASMDQKYVGRPPKLGRLTWRPQRSDRQRKRPQKSVKQAGTLTHIIQLLMGLERGQEGLKNGPKIGPKLRRTYIKLLRCRWGRKCP